MFGIYRGLGTCLEHSSLRDKAVQAVIRDVDHILNWQQLRTC